MPELDVCVVGEINLDLVLYGLPKELVLDRELLASGLALTLGSSSEILPITWHCLEPGSGSSRKPVVTHWGRWHWNGWRLRGLT